MQSAQAAVRLQQAVSAIKAEVEVAASQRDKLEAVGCLEDDASRVFIGITDSHNTLSTEAC